MDIAACAIISFQWEWRREWKREKYQSLIRNILKGKATGKKCGKKNSGWKKHTSNCTLLIYMWEGKQAGFSVALAKRSSNTSVLLLEKFSSHVLGGYWPCVNAPPHYKIRCYSFSWKAILPQQWEMQCDSTFWRLSIVPRTNSTQHGWPLSTCKGSDSTGSAITAVLFQSKLTKSYRLLAFLFSSLTANLLPTSEV